MTTWEHSHVGILYLEPEISNFTHCEQIHNVSANITSIINIFCDYNKHIRTPSKRKIHAHHWSCLLLLQLGDTQQCEVRALVCMRELCVLPLSNSLDHFFMYTQIRSVCSIRAVFSLDHTKPVVLFCTLDYVRFGSKVSL